MGKTEKTEGIDIHRSGGWGRSGFLIRRCGDNPERDDDITILRRGYMYIRLPCTMPLYIPPHSRTMTTV